MKRTTLIVGLLFALLLANCGSERASPGPTTTDEIIISLQTGMTKARIKPDETAVVPAGSQDISGLVHFPQAIGQPQAKLLAPVPASWQLRGETKPADDYYAFSLAGDGDAYMTVEITPGQGIAPLYFSVRVGTALPHIVLTNDGQTIMLSAGNEFLLYLGEEYTWTVDIADQTIVGRVMNAPVIRGAQGRYKALRGGRTTLLAHGDALCRSAQPACAAPSRDFIITLDVRYRPQRMNSTAP